MQLGMAPNASSAPPLVDRAQAILLSPGQEWSRIAQENTSVSDLLVRYVAPLSAVPPVCAVLGLWFSGQPVGPFDVARQALGFAQSLLAVGLLAWIAAWLAPLFKARSDRLAALRLMGYSLTPYWLLGLLQLSPALLPVAALFSLYALFLIHLGLPHLMGCPEDQTLPFTGAIALNMLVLGFGLGTLSQWLSGVVAALS
jgi:hypothetical protein